MKVVSWSGILLFLGCAVLLLVQGAAASTCEHSLGSLTKDEDEEISALQGAKIQIHHNGNPDSCGTVNFDFGEFNSIPTTTACWETMDQDKYMVELILTKIFAQTLPPGDCSSADDETATPGLLGHCYMGDSRTPELLDFNKLRPLEDGSLPCRFFTREGVRINSFQQLSGLVRDARQTCRASATGGGCDDGDEEGQLHLYAVPAGRVFMFAPKRIGETFDLPHVQVASGLPVYLEVMSLSPRVFELYNFFSKDESASLVDKAMNETSETHRIKRSTTGTGTSIFNKRTSESGFDTHGTTAQVIKKRCMSVLGWDEYHEGYTDGLQILRYNTSKSYTTHMDYMSDRTRTDPYDYDSAHKGGNRYATILLYMTDMGPNDGGETVFEHGYPGDLAIEDRQDFKTALQALRDSGDADMLEMGSWEEEMVAVCRSRLAVRPQASRAVLFYSQFPNGTEDLSSKHGGCPVLSDQPKWAANLWTWSHIRSGFAGAPVRKGMEDKANAAKPKQLTAHFRNTNTNPEFKEAELYYDESGYWGKIGHGQPQLTAYTYQGHKWNIKVPGKGFVKQFIIGKDERQVFEI